MLFPANLFAGTEENKIKTGRKNNNLANTKTKYNATQRIVHSNAKKNNNTK